MRERYQRIKALTTQHPVRALCRTLAVSPSGYYAWRQRPVSQKSRTDQRLTELLVEEHLQSRKTYGRPRLLVKLRELGYCHGHTRIARLMRVAHISGRQRRGFRPLTTQSKHQSPIAPNLLACRSVPTASDQVWLTDLTYVQTAEGWLYVSCILDQYSRRVVGWAFGDTLDATLPLRALNMALLQRQPVKGLVHHSDRGCQYASSCYRQTLCRYGINPSMSRAGNCYDNAAMESFWSTLKRELIYRQTYLTRAQASAAIFDYIETFYNPVRIHSALNYKSPVDFEHQNN